MATALDLARRLADGPASLGLTRKLIWDGLDAAWSDQLQAEAEAQGTAGRTAGLRARGSRPSARSARRSSAGAELRA